MRKIATLFVIPFIIVPLLAADAAAQESLMDEYITTFEGRWVCQSTAAQDIDGYWKKGESILNENVYIPESDRSGMRYEVSFTKDEKVVGGVRGISTWDAASKAIKNYGFASPGFHIELKITKEDAKWISEAHLTHPDGAVSGSTVAISVSADGNTHTVVLLKGVDKNGEELEPFTRVWKRISKNQEVLEKEFGWIIGEWGCEMEIPGLGTVPVTAEYEWGADKHVIMLELTSSGWKGLSMIFYDPSDGKIKMWGANSGGGNGQAVLEVNGDELVWTNTVFDGDGRKSVSDFAYVRQPDRKTFVVKFGNEADGTETELTVTKR